MTTGSRTSFLRLSFFIALAYGLAYAGLRTLSLMSITSISWVPMAALRFVCLLFVPTRYWPALIAGEAMSIGYQNYACLDQFGLVWVMTASIPRILYVAPIMHWVRRHAPSMEKQASQNIGYLLSCMLLVSLAVGLHDALNYSLINQLAPGEQPIPLGLYGIKRIAGNYLSILTIVPVVLWLAEGFRHSTERGALRFGIVAKASRQVPWPATGVLITVIVFMTVLGFIVGQAMHVFALCGIVAALAAAAWRYGWQSIILVGAAANVGIVALIPSMNDLPTIQAQCVMAAILSVALMLAARTTSSREHESSIETARQLARREHFASERIRRDHACVLDGLIHDMRLQTMRVLQSARSGAISRRALAAHYQEFDAIHSAHRRITTSMSPPAWSNFGGNGGPMVGALGNIGVQCMLLEPTHEPGASRLPAQLTLALYWLKCETLVYLMKHAPTDRVVLHMATSAQTGRTVTTITLSSVGECKPMPQSIYDELQLGLGVAYLNERRLRERVRLYDGDLEMVPIAPGQMQIVLTVVHHTAR